MIPESVMRQLTDARFRRADPARVDQAAVQLGVALPRDYYEFCCRYEGLLDSDVTGHMLLDICKGHPSVMEETLVAREVHGFPRNWLVIGALGDGGILVYDIQQDVVFDTDFEGGIDQMKRGGLEPRWGSFAAFLEEFFSGNEPYLRAW